MYMYNLIEYSNTYLKTSGSLWQYFRDEAALDNNSNIIDFPADNNNSNLFKFRLQITGKSGKGGTKYVEIMVPLEYLGNFWRTVQTPLINCEISLQLICSKKSILAAGTVANQVPKFKRIGTKLNVPVVTLSTQENIKLLKQLESGLERTNNWNKYHSKKSIQAQNRYLQGVNRLFVLSFEGDDDRKIY